MNRMKTPRSTCSTESCSTRYGPDAPVRLGRIEGVVADPPAAGRLQQRVVEEEAEAAAGAHDPGDLVDRTVHIVDVLEHEARDRGVERPSANGNSAAPDRTYAGPPARSPATADLIPGRVDADHGRTGGRQQPADLTVTAADVEHPVESGQFRSRQRQDLLLVLGVGAGGEAVDPPVGVFLPQVTSSGQPRRRSRRGYEPRAPVRCADEVLRVAQLRAVPCPRSSNSPASPTPRDGTASGTPTTTCRTPAARRSPPGDMHECWAMLPAIAAVTERVRLGSLVAPHVGPPSGGPRQPGGDDRPHLQRPAGARHRRRLADQRAPRLRHRTRAAGHAGRPVRGGDPDRPQPVRERAHHVRGHALHDHRRPDGSEAGAVAAADPRRHGEPAHAAHHGAHTPTNGTRGARPSWPAPASTKFLAACERVGRDPADDAHVRAGAGDRHRRCRRGRRRCAPAHGGAHDRRLDRPDRRARSAGYVDLGFDEFIVPDWAFADDLDTPSRSARRALRRPHRRPRLTVIVVQSSFASGFPWPGRRKS